MMLSNASGGRPTAPRYGRIASLSLVLGAEYRFPGGVLATLSLFGQIACEPPLRAGGVLGDLLLAPCRGVWSPGMARPKDDFSPAGAEYRFPGGVDATPPLTGHTAEATLGGWLKPLSLPRRLVAGWFVRVWGP